ncbi:hypothetical protein D3C80_1694000 [compost metagenome]
MLARQAPADFGRGGEGGLEPDHAQTGKPDERPRVLALQCPQTETMLGEMTTDSPDQCRTFQPAQGCREIAHDLRIGTHGRECRQIVVAPLAHQQSRTLQLQYRLHLSPLPFPCKQVYIAGRILHSFTP